MFLRQSALVKRSCFFQQRYHFSKSPEKEKIPSTLPLLEEHVKFTQRGQSSKPLAGHHVLLIQHQMGEHLSMVNSLIQLGLQPHKTHSIDIPYSAQSRIVEKLKQIPIPESNIHQHKYTLDQEYSSYQRNRVSKIARSISGLLSVEDTLIVVDDGAYYLEALSKMEERPKHKISLVEQTTRGLIKLREDPTMHSLLQYYPVINVADSLPKRQIEPKHIAKNVVEFLFLVLEQEDPQKDYQSLQYLITGYGSIGKSVAKADHFKVPASQIFIQDIHQDKIAEFTKDGFSSWNQQHREKHPHPKFDIVIGCSGTVSFSPADHVWLKDGAVVVSASSGNHECSFDVFVSKALAGREQFQVLNPEVLKSSNIHQTVLFKSPEGRKFKFLNGGFPITFLGKLFAVPSENIQPTLAMMAAATVQASRSFGHTGLIPLDGHFCDWLMNHPMVQHT